MQQYNLRVNEELVKGLEIHRTLRIRTRDVYSNDSNWFYYKKIVLT